MAESSSGEEQLKTEKWTSLMFNHNWKVGVSLIASLESGVNLSLRFSVFFTTSEDIMKVIELFLLSYLLTDGLSLE